ncbi:MAG TPA: hypothetical protein VF546_19780 [Pyrinomonadaceae bacterium]|jgi:hypothetical protein
MNLDLLNLLAQAATLVSVVIGIVGVWLGVRIYRRQINAQIFMAYAERYERIMESFPDFHLRFDINNPPPESDQLRLCVLKYLNLSSEEYYMWRSKYLDDEVWKIWEHELKRMLQSKLIKDAWQDLRKEFESYPAFLDFVEKAQQEKWPARASRDG